jgi:hypothetical protein
MLGNAAGVGLQRRRRARPDVSEVMLQRSMHSRVPDTQEWETIEKNGLPSGSARYLFKGERQGATRCGHLPASRVRARSPFTKVAANGSHPTAAANQHLRPNGRILKLIRCIMPPWAWIGRLCLSQFRMTLSISLGIEHAPMSRHFYNRAMAKMK